MPIIELTESIMFFRELQNNCCKISNEKKCGFLFVQHYANISIEYSHFFSFNTMLSCWKHTQMCNIQILIKVHRQLCAPRHYYNIVQYV